MESQTLDNMLSSVPEMAEVPRDYTSIDVYTSGAAEMYCQWNPFCNCPNGRQLSNDPLFKRDQGFVPLGTNVVLDINKSNPNTAVIKEVTPLGGDNYLQNTYIHHPKGPGRMVTDILPK